MIEKLAIIAVGGNSLMKDPKSPNVEQQWQAVQETCVHVADMIMDGWHVVMTHGNGPQVGHGLRRSELGMQYGLHGLTLDMIGAETQGSIGYMLQQALDNELRRRGLNRTVATVITQVRVDPDDPAFENPTKPVGSFMDEHEAEDFKAEGWHVVNDAGRGWRRVVASPRPHYIQEINAIQALMLNGYVVITAGGGGIPVVRDPVGNLQGVYAVIDKDRASSLLAQTLRADLFIISTAVPQVALNYNTPEQVNLNRMSLDEARGYITEGHFAPGSMLPKIEAAVEFVHHGGPRAIITDPPHLVDALTGNVGTSIVPG